MSATLEDTSEGGTTWRTAPPRQPSLYETFSGVEMEELLEHMALSYHELQQLCALEDNEGPRAPANSPVSLAEDFQHNLMQATVLDRGP